ncbi:MAG: hypothetical protein IPP83_08165 [Flavobacteriales bacterium]|nr:hypothetical protein [Flavobacteriales bacterium]
MFMVTQPDIGSCQWSILDSGTEEFILSIASTPGGTLRAMGADMRESTDGGDTWVAWQPSFFDLPLVGGYWPAMHFTSELEGFMVGGMDFNNQFVILRTNDGGQSWITSHAAAFGVWPQYHTRIEFPTSSTGFVCGTNGIMMKSVDSGNSWTVLGTGTASSIYGMHFWSASTGIIVTATDIRRTVNGGNNWSVVASGTNLGGLGWLPSGDMYAAGDNMVLVSTNMGTNWTSHPAPFSDVEDVVALDAGTVMVSALQGIAVSHDAGIWWEYYPPPASGELHDLLVSGAQTVVAVGEEGRIIRTTNGGGTSVPIPAFTHAVQYSCGEAVLELIADCDPDLSLSWMIDGLIVSSANELSITYTAPSTYDLIALVADNGSFSDTATWSANINVDQLVTVDAGPDVAQCFGSVAQLNATGALNYTWSPTTALSGSTSANPTTSATVNTTYIVTGTSGLCVDADTVNVIVAPSIPLDPWSTIFYSTAAADRFIIMDWTDDYNGYVVCSQNMRVTHDGGATWATYPSPYPMGNGFNLTYVDLEMVDDSVGYFTNNSVLKTVNGGQTWTTISNYTTMGDEFLSVDFLNRDTGFVMGNYIAGVGDRGIYRTVNGAANWELIRQDNGLRLYDMVAVNWDTIIAVGGLGTSAPRVLHTHDGGALWQDTLIASAVYSLYEITVSPEGVITSTGVDDELRSWDGGTTWERRPRVAGARSNLSWQSADTAFCSGGSELYKSVNGGDCYEQVAMLMPQSILDVSSSEPGRTHVASKVGLNNGALIRSTNDIPLRQSAPRAVANEVLRAWPNPAMERATILLPSTWASASVLVVDAVGRSVLETQVFPVVGAAELILSEVPAGSYTIIAASNGSRLTTPLIIR